MKIGKTKIQKRRRSASDRQKENREPTATALIFSGSYLAFCISKPKNRQRLFALVIAAHWCVTANSLCLYTELELMFRSAWGLLNAMGYSFHSAFSSRACGQNGTLLLLLTYQYLIDRRQPGVSGVLTMPHLPYKITTHFKYHYEKTKRYLLVLCCLHRNHTKFSL